MSLPSLSDALKDINCNSVDRELNLCRKEAGGNSGACMDIGSQLKPFGDDDIITSPARITAMTSSTQSSVTSSLHDSGALTTDIKLHHTAALSTAAPTAAAGGASQVKECASCCVRIWDRYLLSCMGRHWHTGCLKCSCCQAPLGDIGRSCFAKNGMILCKNDYLR